MNPRDIEPAVLQVLRRIAPEADPAHIDRDTPLADQLDLDSMDHLNFVAALSVQFGIDIPEVDYPRLVTLAGCRDYLARATGAG
jgi:acyl carrier protein